MTLLKHALRIKIELGSARKRVAERNYPANASRLLGLVQNDPEAFYHNVCHTNEGMSEFARVPLLQSIEPDQFVAAWLNARKDGWHWIRQAFEERYQGNRLEDELREEKDWLVKIHENLVAAASSDNDRLSAFRINRITPDILSRVGKKSGPTC